MKIAVFPGSFDPITLGHTDIICRALTLFDKIIIGVGINTNKNYLFGKEKRMEMIEKTFINESKIEVKSYEGLTINFCKKVGAKFILRGIRNPADFEFEKSISYVNKSLSGIETIFLITNPENSFISSSLVRDVHTNGGDVSDFIPKGLKL